MNQDQLKHFEEIIFKAVQSGKQETDGLVEMVIHRMEPMIDKSVGKYTEIYTEKYTNGKLKLLDAKNDQHAMEIKHEQAELKKAFENFKKEIIPQIESVKEFKGWGKVTLGLLGFLSAIGGCILLIMNLLRNIK